MSEQLLSLNESLHTKLVLAFGEPHSTLCHDVHWMLRPRLPAMAINVLVNGTLSMPALWVFDPNDRDQNTFKSAITSELQINDAIKEIRERVKRAETPAVVAG